MFSNTKARGELVIAGQNSGKPVKITPQAEPIYRELVKLAKSSKNYWALLTVNGINDLACGRLHQSNIFIKPGSVHRNGVEEFEIILPGCKATAEKLDGDGFRILHMEADVGYFKLQADGTKPGLYAAEKGANNRWTTTFKKDGHIESTRSRRVAITDSNWGVPSETANTAFDNIGEAPFADGDTLTDNGFDMHYTPGTPKLGKLMSYRHAIKPLGNSELNESALLLARTMLNAKKTKGVGWIAEFGGSGVLTQAMKILADQGVTLDNHRVYLHRPTTSPNEALKQAQRLKLQLSRDFSKSAMTDWVGNQSQLKVIFNRLCNEHDNYKLSQAAKDTWSYGASAQGLATLAVGGVSWLSGAAGLSLTAPAVPAMLSFLGAFAASGAAALGTANAVTKSVAPKFHNKHIKGNL